jgi:hypothetical protein
MPAKTDIAVEFEDVTYHVPPVGQWPIDAMEAAEQGRGITATRLVLGDDQWAEFRKHHSTGAEVEAFMDAIKAVIANG